MATLERPYEDALADSASDYDPGPSRAYLDDVARLLDPSSWMEAAGLLDTYAAMEREVSAAIRDERRLVREIRQRLFPQIEISGLAGDISGVYRAEPSQVEAVQNGLLINGNVEACHGVGMTHRTLALTFVQIGVCMVRYDGDHQSWAQRLYRRDHALTGDPLSDMLETLDARRSAGSGGRSSGPVSRLARSALTSYAQRLFLSQRSDARWRMGRGRPAPFDLITGAGLVSPAPEGMTYPLMQAGMEVLRELLLGHKRFVFVAERAKQEEDDSLFTIGEALNPLEYAIIDTIGDDIEAIERTGNYDDAQRAVISAFRKDVGDVVVSGVFRASRAAPPAVFYAHRDHAHPAALIAIADSALQLHRGFPTLLDLAHTVCRATFGMDSYAPDLRVAYTDAGAPWIAPQVTMNA